MKLLLTNVPALAFMGVGVFLLMHDHYTAGGGSLIAAFLAVRVPA